jgi:flagellar basal body-associated protein FliL
MKKNKDLYKFIAFVIVFIFIISTIIFFKDWFSKHMFGIDNNFTFNGSGQLGKRNKNIYYAYTAEKQKYGNNFAVKFKNIIASSANKDKYFLVDLTFIVNNEDEAEIFEKQKDNISAIIKEILSEYSFNHIKSKENKQYLKEQIRKHVEQKLGKNIIKELYIETILYN